MNEPSNVRTFEEDDSLSADNGLVAAPRDANPGEDPPAKSKSRHRVLFENSPLSLWEEDWSEVHREFDRLRATGVTDFRAYFEAHEEAVRACAGLVRVVDVNQASVDLLHAKGKGDLLLGLETIFTPRAFEVFREELIALAGGAWHFEGEATLRTFTGEILDVAVYVAVAPGAEERLDTVLVSVLDITARKQTEAAALRARRKLEQILEFQEHERRLIGYEIHDGLAQQLAGAKLLLQSFREQRGQTPEAWDVFEAGLDLLDEAMAESRRLIGGLRPAALDEDGVVPALEDLADQMRARWGLEIEFVHRVRFRRLVAPLETAVFRIVQEALTNVRRHSGSKRAGVEMVQEGDRLRLEIRDWGRGFDPQAVPPSHFGLEGIHERVHLLGGRAVIESADGQGTRILLDLPVLENAEDSEADSLGPAS